MSAIASTSIDAETKNAATSGRLFFLDLSAGRIISANPDGSDLKTIINDGRKLPDERQSRCWQLTRRASPAGERENVAPKKRKKE